jgi:hypothetical protein
MNVIKTIEYPGSIDNFRAFIGEFFLLHKEVFSTDTSHYTYLGDSRYETSSRSIWNIIETTDGNIFFGTSRSSIILASEKFPNKTTVQFIDGKSASNLFRTEHDNPPIGNDFLTIAELMASQIKSTDDLPKEPTTRNLNDWFDYFYRVKPTRWKINMGYIAKQSNYGINTVYKEHTLYKIRHSIERKIMVRNSKKK